MTNALVKHGLLVALVPCAGLSVDSANSPQANIKLAGYRGFDGQFSAPVCEQRGLFQGATPNGWFPFGVPSKPSKLPGASFKESTLLHGAFLTRAMMPCMNPHRLTELMSILQATGVAFT